MTTWISGTNGIVKKADVSHVYSKKENIYDWRVYAKTNNGVDVLLYAGIDEAKHCEKYIKYIMNELEKVEPVKDVMSEARKMMQAATERQEALGRVPFHMADAPVEEIPAEKKKVKMYKYKCLFECGADIDRLKACDKFVRKNFKQAGDSISFSSPLCLDDLVKLMKSLQDCDYMWQSLNYAKHFNYEFVRVR